MFVCYSTSFCVLNNWKGLSLMRNLRPIYLCHFLCLSALIRVIHEDRRFESTASSSEKWYGTLYSLSRFGAEMIEVVSYVWFMVYLFPLSPLSFFLSIYLLLLGLQRERIQITLLLLPFVDGYSHESDSIKILRTFETRSSLLFKTPLYPRIWSLKDLWKKRTRDVFHRSPSMILVCECICVVIHATSFQRHQ